MQSVFALHDLRSIGTIDPPVEGSGPERVGESSPPGVVNDPGRRIGYELLRAGYERGTRRTVLFAAFVPRYRVMRGITFLRDAEDAEANNNVKASLLAWQKAERDLLHFRANKSLLRALKRSLGKWGLDAKAAHREALRVDHAIHAELLPLAHLRAYLRRPVVNGQPDPLQWLHLQWMCRWPMAVTDELASGGALAIGILLGSGARGVIQALAILADTALLSRLPASTRYSLISHVMARLWTVQKDVWSTYQAFIEQKIEQIAVSTLPHAGLARYRAAVYACKTPDTSPDGLRHSLRSLALDPVGLHAQELFSRVQAFIYSGAEGAYWYDEFIRSEEYSNLLWYRSEAIAQETLYRLSSNDPANDTEIRNLLDALDRLSSNHLTEPSPQTLTERLFQACSLLPHQWASVAATLDYHGDAIGVEGLSVALPLPADPLETLRAYASDLPTGVVFNRLGPMGAQLHRLEYLGSARDWGAKLGLAASLILLLHGMYRLASHNVHQWMLDRAHDRALATGHVTDSETRLESALEFLRADSDPNDVDPRHEDVFRVAVVATHERLESYSESGDANASLDLIEEVAPYLAVPEVLNELKGEVDQIVLDKVSALAFANEDDEAERLLVRYTSVMGLLE